MKEQLIKTTIINTYYRSQVTIQDLLDVISYHLQKLEYSEQEIATKINSIKFNIPTIQSLFDVSREFCEREFHMKKIINSQSQIIKVYF